jgi:hypothetical protein
MKYVLRTVITCLLSVAVLVCALPATVLAADNEPVLTSIRHSSAVAAVGVAGVTTATLTVPYSHGNQVNLSQGLDVSFHTSIYAVAIPTFPNGATATVGGEAVDMVVTYQRKNSSTLYTTTYKIKVVRAEFAAPSFSGSIAKSTNLSQSITFALSDFSDKYVKNDGGDLASIVISGSNPSFGTLKLANGIYTPGTPVSVTDLKNGRLTFSATGAGSVTYLVQALATGDSGNPIGSVLLTITANHVPPAFSGTITKTVSLTDGLTLTLSDFASLYKKNDGGALASVVLTGGNSSIGRLRLRGQDYSLGTAVSASDLSAGRLTFAGASAGTAVYTVKAYAADNSTTPVGSATLRIEVQHSSAAEIFYVTGEAEPTTLDADDLAAACEELTGEELWYVRFTLPPSAYGKLYYDYVSPTNYDSTVSSGTRYYTDFSPYLSRVTFVPKAGFSGTASITYTGYGADGEAYTGVVKVIVREGSDHETEEITYVTNSGTPVTFDVDDFDYWCKVMTGDELSSVEFKLPSTFFGRLYYNYTSPTQYGSVVSEGDEFHKYFSPYLSRVTFVPRAGYSGTLSIAYTGYDEDGDAFTGSVKITVNEAVGDITYTATRGQWVSFDATVFNEVCEDVTGETLSYVRFTLPSSSYGTLYHNFTSPTQPGSKVSSSTRYYRLSSPGLSGVTFVANAGYTGTVSITYTGYSVEGQSYTGTVKVTVQDYKGSQYFDDVDTTYWWCSEAVDYLFKKGIVTGVGGRRYSPGVSISRGDFVLMLCRAFDLDTIAGDNFPDVQKGSHYYNAIATAKALGIARGGDGGLFRPTESLTRQDAMVLIMRALDYAPQYSVPSGSASHLTGFSDRAEIAEYARDHAAALVRAGIIRGSDGKLNPLGKVTRAEMATIVHRILTRD